MTPSVHVLVIDDSALVRQSVQMLLSRSTHPKMRVTIAADATIGRRKMEKDPPDVIWLDLELPGWHGLDFLRWVMRERPTPVLVCSEYAGAGTETLFRAIEEGAVDIITKPQLGLDGFFRDSAVNLVESVSAASSARVRTRGRARPAASVMENAAPSPRLDAGAVLPRRSSVRPIQPGNAMVVAVGASTGGIEAIQTLLEGLPVNAPGIVVVQHIPEGFARSFAERMDRILPLDCKEAANGDMIRPGRVLIAPGGKHLMVRRSGTNYIAEISDGPPVNRHKPSVDVLFRSVAQQAGRNGVGVLLTGMGDDGARGLLEMKESGASTIAQSEGSCVVYGMPKEAIRRGAADQVLDLSRIPGAILSARRGSAPPKADTRPQEAVTG